MTAKSLARLLLPLIALSFFTVGPAFLDGSTAWADRAKGLQLAGKAARLYKRAQQDITNAEKAEIYAEIDALIETILREHDDSPPAMAFEDAKVYAGIDRENVQAFLERWRSANPDWEPGKGDKQGKDGDRKPDEVPQQAKVDDEPPDPAPVDPKPRELETADDDPNGEPDPPSGNGQGQQQVIYIPMPVPTPNPMQVPKPEPTPEPQPDPVDSSLSRKELVQMLKEATVFLLVVTDLGDGSVSLGEGTGFFIGEDLVMTNQHVVESSSDEVYAVSEEIGIDRASYVTGTNMQGGEGLDVALIRLKSYRSPTYLRFASDFFISQEIVISGYPGIANNVDKGYVDLQNYVHARLQGQQVSFQDNMAPSLKYSFGRLQSYYKNQSNYEVLQHGAQTAGGNSGSAVVNVCGEVIGIHALGAYGDDHEAGNKYNYAYSVREIVQFLGGQSIPFQVADNECDGGESRSSRIDTSG